ncbi:hypothetical protein BDW22DRAFT_1361187 [Trametopsis cervina]|nr:hypothetical protein BDW22DRAFT_1361187 [Trametopsis cervina]
MSGCVDFTTTYKTAVRLQVHPPLRRGNRDVELGHPAITETADTEGDRVRRDNGALVTIRSQPPPSIRLSPYHFLNFSIIFTFGCWKAVASYRGQATLSTTLDMLVGTILPLLMLMIGLCGSKCPSYLKWFFDSDLLDLLRRSARRAMRRQASASGEYVASPTPGESVWTDSDVEGPLNVAMPVPSPYEFHTPYVYQPRGAESTEYELRVSIGAPRRPRRGMMRRAAPSLQATLPLPVAALG